MASKLATNRCGVHGKFERAQSFRSFRGNFVKYTVQYSYIAPHFVETGTCNRSLNNIIELVI